MRIIGRCPPSPCVGIAIPRPRFAWAIVGTVIFGAFGFGAATAMASELTIEDRRFGTQNLKLSSAGAQTAESISAATYVVGPDNSFLNRPIIPFAREDFDGNPLGSVIDSATLTFDVVSDFAEAGESFTVEVRLFSIDETNLTSVNKDAFAAKTGDGGDHTVIGNVLLEADQAGTMTLEFPAAALAALEAIIEGDDATLGVAFREFESDDLDEFLLGAPPGVVSITMRSLGGNIAVTPARVDFDDVPSGVAEIVIANSGDAPLEVSAISLSPAGSEICDPFDVTAPALPLVLAQGDSDIVEVGFEPPDEATRDCRLVIAHDDPLRAPVEVGLGTGVDLDVKLTSPVASVGQGELLPYSLEIFNDGTDLAFPDIGVLLLSLDPPTGDPFVVKTMTLSLDAGGSISQDLFLPLPPSTPVGDWKFMVFAVRAFAGFQDSSQIEFTVVPAP